jgi:hypothetical protein
MLGPVGRARVPSAGEKDGTSTDSPSVAWGSLMGSVTGAARSTPSVTAGWMRAPAAY